MGIFDDAIREHLELKRHAGVDEEELKELEDEAFGPPARPGDPDFPGSTSEEAAVESEAPAEGAVFDAETDEAKTSDEAAIPDDAVTEAPAEERAPTPIDEATAPETDEAPVEPASEETAVQEEPAAEAPAPEPEPEPAPDPAEASSFTTEEREAIADQPTVFFEQQPPEEMELGDLELDIDEEIEEVGGAVLRAADGRGAADRRGGLLGAGPRYGGRRDFAGG